MKTHTKYWVEPTLRSVRDSVVSLVPNDINYQKTYELVRNAPIVRVPYAHFKNIPYFEPYERRDLHQDPRVRRIVRGFKRGEVPMVLATCTKNNIDVYDGFTRAAVAMALHIPIYAKAVFCKEK